MPLDLNFLAGTYFIEDDGIRGNNRSRIRGADGTIYGTFEHPADTLRFLATEPGVNFVFNIADFLATAVVTVGDPDNPAVTPNSIVVRSIRSDGFVTLASNGAITEGGSDTAADILANAIVFSAVTGVGSAGNAIETETSFIEAETNTGGINLSNYGSLQIGNISSSVEGLDVFNSGDLKVTTTGFFLFNDTTGLEVVHGGDISGNVTLSAIGPDSDMFATVDLPVVSAAGGGITLNAGRDLYLGTAAANFNNDVLAARAITINAGRDFVLDGTSDLLTSAFGGVPGGHITIIAGRNIGLTDTSGGLQSIRAFNGNLVLTTGPGGTYTQDAEMNSVISTGDITINADQAAINDGGIVAGYASGIGQVTIRPVSPGRAIDLGNPLDPAGALALSNAEFNRIGAPSLAIGDMNSGPVSVNAALAFSFVNDLTIRSATEILVDSSFFVQGSLTLRAGDDIFVTAAGSINAASGGLSLFVDDVQDDDGSGGNGSLFGGILASTTVKITGNLDADELNGGAADDMLMGNAGNDILRGFGGADLLNGGLGRDTMTGGTEDDIYIVDSSLDVTTELAGEGFDTVQSSVTHTLAADVEKLVLTGTAAINGTGNGLDNMIFGNAGNNLIDGKAGVDNLRGGDGDDILVVQDVGDSVVELAGGGTDLVRSSITFTLSSNVENLTLQGGAAAINGTGNTLANIITGNVGANILSGAGGADTMIGLAGNDTYIVDNVGDIVTEAAAGGTADKVQSSINYTLGAELENLTLTGAAVSGTGNSLANTIIGNNAANSLAGVDGADILKGVNNDDTLNGGLGNDELFGGVGNDNLIGGGGLDKYRFDTALSAANNVDDILDYSVADDSIYLDRLIFTGIAADGPLSAASVRLGTAALDADDRIIYDSALGNIFYDSDGIGAAAQILFATVDAGTALTRLDFFAYTG